MEEDEDDFYADAQNQNYDDAAEVAPERDVKMEASDEDEDEEEDSDDDVQFITDKAEGVKSEPGTTTRGGKQTASQDRKVTDSKPARAGTPLQDGRAESLQPTAIKGTLTYNGKEGKDLPEVRTSKIDVNGNPIWPANGKPITDVDIDADLAEHSKPWRLPGTDLTDFFNYGFDEYTWAQYCVRQKEVSDSITEGKRQDAEMKAFFEGGGNTGGGGPPGMPPGMPPMPAMPGMPNPQEMMQQMMAAGYDPTDQNAFMSFMMNQGYGPPGAGGGNFGGQNSASPHPQGGHGFQPPQGPGVQHGGDQGGFGGGNMEGYSPQQIAILQQQQGGQGGGRGRGRGRGRW